MLDFYKSESFRNRTIVFREFIANKFWRHENRRFYIFFIIAFIAIPAFIYFNTIILKEYDNTGSWISVSVFELILLYLFGKAMKIDILDELIIGLFGKVKDGRE